MKTFTDLIISIWKEKTANLLKSRKTKVKKELEIWKFALSKLVRNESLMLLVVAESSGSSPGREGFKMIVAGDETAGSIGGGVMEVNLVDLAKRILNNKSINPRLSKNAESKSFLKLQIHQKNSPNSSGMICSGKQTVVFFTLDSNHIETVRDVISAIENNQSRILQISDFGFQISENQSADFSFKFERKDHNEYLFQEKLGYKNKLFIVGGGHCALALSEIMEKMDFHISLFDDRKDLNTLAKNKFVDAKKIIVSYQNINEFIESGNNIYVVVMTLGYKFDEIVIRKLFDKEFKYFGVLGSRAKMKTLMKKLEKEGFDKEKLANINTPIGLHINSRTPEEIAVSIAAEIIAVKNGAKL